MRSRGHPTAIWVLAGGGALSAVGTSMVIPLLTLFFTERHGVGLTAATGLLALFFTAGTVGNLLGGSIADGIGRRPVILGSLVGASISSVVVGFSHDIVVAALGLALLGLSTSALRPAAGALVADLVPSSGRPRTFALLRVAFNAGFAIGPALAGAVLAFGRDARGLLDANAYRPLFVVDAVTSAAFALLAATFVKETLGSGERGDGTGVAPGRKATTRGSYREVFADRGFVVFAIVWALVLMLYIQLFSTVGPYLASEHSFPVERFAALLSINAGLVVVAQIWVTRRAGRLGARRTLASGLLLYGASLLFVDVATTTLLVTLVIGVFTVGEMLLAPTGDALAADFAREDNRGRYLGVYSFASAIGLSVGPVVGGLLIDRGLGRALWSGAFAVSLLAALSFLRLLRPRALGTQGSELPYRELGTQGSELPYREPGAHSASGPHPRSQSPEGIRVSGDSSISGRAT